MLHLGIRLTTLSLIPHKDSLPHIKINALPVFFFSLLFHLFQVKISNHLGDDIQYLILLQSAPSKAKIATGPAKMHVQDHRICLTTGVPPRLAGLWNIAHLR